MEKESVEKIPPKKRRPFIVRLLLFILWLIVALVVVLGAWLAYSALDRKSSLQKIPAGYSVYVQTDKLWPAVNPIIDLKAADIILSEPDFMDYRALLMELRAASWRRSPLVNFALSRNVSAVLYTPYAPADEEKKSSFFAVADLSFLSAATRLSPVIGNFLRIEKLTYNKRKSGLSDFFEYETDSSVFYIKPYHNLVLVTDNFDFLSAAMSTDFSVLYSQEQLDLLLERVEQPVKLLVNPKKLLSTSDSGDTVYNSFVGMLKEDGFASVAFGISDSDIEVSARVPFDFSANPDLQALFERQATVPSLISRLGKYVQYYTVINVGSVEELKNGLFPLFPQEKNIDDLWQKADSLSRFLFGTGLDQVLFSWTGRELAAFGIDGLNNPVFAVQVVDEAKRSEIFDRLNRSIAITSDTSLIVDGVRIPRLKLPVFFQGLLSLFGISLPSPYYLVENGFVYFSESPECLSSVHNSLRDGDRIVTTQSWQQINGASAHQSTVELFYDLERSVPFFLRGNNVFSDILQLYSMGSCEILSSGSTLSFALHSIARPSGSLRLFPGFPVELEKKAEPVLYRTSREKKTLIVWLEDGGTVCSIEIPSMKMNRRELGENMFLCVSEAADGGIWACSQSGTVYLMDEALQLASGFPCFTGNSVEGGISAYQGGIAFPAGDGSLCFVSRSGRVQTVRVSENPSGSLKAAPGVLDEYLAVYEKSFAGRIYVYENGEPLNPDEPLSVPGIAYDSPCLMKSSGFLYVGFITQSGNLYIWAERNGSFIEELSMRLDGVFYKNLVASGNYFYALSDDATLYRISLDGKTLRVQLPGATAKKGYISVQSPEGNGVNSVYVCADANLIYGFNEQLELLAGFPLAGTGTPAFVDANVDSFADCFVITLDNKLTAWLLR